MGVRPDDAWAERQPHSSERIDIARTNDERTGQNSTSRDHDLEQPHPRRMAARLQIGMGASGRRRHGAIGRERWREAVHVENLVRELGSRA